MYWVVQLCSVQLPTKVLDRLQSISQVLTEDVTNCHITRITLHAKWEVQTQKARHAGLQSAFFRLSKVHNSRFPKYHSALLISKVVRGVANLVKSYTNWL